MKVVIDVNDGIYEEILSGKDGWSNYVHGLIRTGTPLPKGHGGLIDKEALEIAWHEGFLNGMSLSSGMLNIFRDAPVVIEEESEEE